MSSSGSRLSSWVSYLPVNRIGNEFADPYRGDISRLRTEFCLMTVNTRRAAASFCVVGRGMSIVSSWVGRRSSSLSAAYDVTARLIYSHWSSHIQALCSGCCARTFCSDGQ